MYIKIKDYEWWECIRNYHLLLNQFYTHEFHKEGRKVVQANKKQKKTKSLNNDTNIR